MQTAAVANGVSAFEMLERAEEVPSLSARAINAAKAFAAMVRHWKKIAGTQRVPETGGRIRYLMEDVVRRAGIDAMLKKKAKTEAEDEDPLGNVNGLITEAAKYDSEFPEGSLDDFLAGVSLRTDVDSLREGDGAVTLMTLHAAKGLEFPVVAMIGLEEGVLPHARARDDPSQMEEERRLCFVGITRAQERLILTKSAFRTIRGLRERTVSSPFFAEMPEELLDVTDRTGLPGAEEISFARQEQQSSGQFQPGMLVRHPRFGLGRIADLSTLGSQTRAVVQFNTAGRKTLILEYAHLEAVGETNASHRISQ
jgi:DNA helicase-2/ATP-dependent DNA helicase PcrA